jgi:hypothetical protein
VRNVSAARHFNFSRDNMRKMLAFSVPPDTGALPL